METNYSACGIRCIQPHQAETTSQHPATPKPISIKINSSLSNCWMHIWRIPSPHIGWKCWVLLFGANKWRQSQVIRSRWRWQHISAFPKYTRQRRYWQRPPKTTNTTSETIKPSDADDLNRMGWTGKLSCKQTLVCRNTKSYRRLTRQATPYNALRCLVVRREQQYPGQIHYAPFWRVPIPASRIHPHVGAPGLVYIKCANTIVNYCGVALRAPASSFRLRHVKQVPAKVSRECVTWSCGSYVWRLFKYFFRQRRDKCVSIQCYPTSFSSQPGLNAQ